MKKLMIISVITAMMFSMGFNMSGCKVPAKIAAKSGAQLWGENCTRCHFVPSPADFGDPDWELIVSHMRLRANLTATESKKIVEFLKMTN